MDKYFICLANSYKRVDSNGHGDETGRCIAGVEVEITEVAEKTVLESIVLFTNHYGTRPNWIRPKGNTETGAIPVDEARPFKVFDLIRLSDVESTVEGAHSEDYEYSLIERVSHINVDEDLLSRMCDNLHKNYVFGNRYDSVTDEKFLGFDHSLMLIKPNNPTFYYMVREYDGRRKKQLRCKFSYGRCEEYDLVVTDPEFKQLCFEAHDDDLKDVNANNNCYFVMSLGIALPRQNNKHYKLIASVITIK